MANEVLKQIFQELQVTVVAINPSSVMDVLFSKKVISSDDYDNLRQFTAVKERCREMLSLLYRSAYPQAFIHLRLALLDEYSYIVEEIDQKLTSLTSQLQQLHMDSTDGNYCAVVIDKKIVKC